MWKCESWSVFTRTTCTFTSIIWRPRTNPNRNPLGDPCWRGMCRYGVIIHRGVRSTSWTNLRYLRSREVKIGTDKVPAWGLAGVRHEARSDGSCRKEMSYKFGLKIFSRSIFSLKFILNIHTKFPWDLFPSFTL